MGISIISTQNGIDLLLRLWVLLEKSRASRSSVIRSLQKNMYIPAISEKSDFWKSFQKKHQKNTLSDFPKTKHFYKTRKTQKLRKYRKYQNKMKRYFVFKTNYQNKMKWYYGCWISEKSRIETHISVLNRFVHKCPIVLAHLWVMIFIAHLQWVCSLSFFCIFVFSCSSTTTSKK